ASKVWRLSSKIKYKKFWGLFFLLSNTITAEPGQDVVLPCRIPAGKIIQGMKWNRADLEEYVLFFRDERLDPDGQHPFFKNRVDLQDRKMNNGDASLVLKNVTTADDGSYSCNIFNKETKSWESINTHVVYQFIDISE
uniref:Ig-like domain-containing protein n=1 Tax=Astatotilapia calliptera TaxID=8154 RepID=A0A3P8NEC8_ASTCA